MTNFEDVKRITSSEYFSGDEFSSNIFDAKYSHTKEDGTKETPAEVFYRVSSLLANQETSETNKKHYRDLWFSLLWDGWFRPGGSIISGIGSSRKASLANCTTVPLPEDTLESIAKCEYDLMKVAAYRQGVGVDLSKLRPRGSKVGNAAEESTGTIPWMDKLTRIGDYVGQLGRKPAMLVSLNVSHPDIEEFISCKDNLSIINNANISVQITNAFMEAVINDEEWELKFVVDSHKQEITRKVSAKKLFEFIAEHANKAAEPGIQFIDLMKKGSMIQAIADASDKHEYDIISTNACSEKPMPKYSVCNLLSINAEMFSTKEDEYKKQLEEIVPSLVRLSDNVISYELEHNLSPLPEQRKMVQELREIGMGVTNIHGWVLKQDLEYDSDVAREKIVDFIKHYSYVVFKTSVELGKEKGNAPGFDLIKDDTSCLSNSVYSRSIVEEFYEGYYSKISNLRNCAHMSIAPTGSLSAIFPTQCFSSGIEPVIGAYYWRRTRAVEKGIYTYYFVVPNRVKEFVLNKIEDKSNKDYKLLSEFPGSVLDENGKVGLKFVDIINKYTKTGLFKPAHLIDPIQKVKLMGEVYNWIDSAISCTYNIPEDSTTETVENIYLEAYNNGVRAVSIYRDKSRQGILIFEDPITNKQNFESQSNTKQRPEFIQYNCAPPRPKELPCSIHHCTIKGEPWIVLVGLLYGYPYEIFCGNNLDIPKQYLDGALTKVRSGVYNLNINGDSIKDVASLLMNDEQKTAARLLSLSMRHGVPLEYIKEQVKKAGGIVGEFSSVISRVLSKYIKEYEYHKAEKCPSCNQEFLVKMESCIKCENCGYSRCE